MVYREIINSKWAGNGLGRDWRGILCFCRRVGCWVCGQNGMGIAATVTKGIDTGNERVAIIIV